MTPIWDDRVAGWVASRIFSGQEFGECRAMGVLDRDGRLCAGVVFHDWSLEHGTVELSCAADNRRWLTRSVAAACFGYAFSVSRLVVARNSETNHPASAIWRALGATEYRIADLWGPGEAAYVFTLTQGQWQASRLARGHHGQIKSTKAA